MNFRQETPKKCAELELASTEISASINTINERIKKHPSLRTETLEKLARIGIKIFRGIVPICASCKKIRDDKNNWHRVESYIQENSEAKFSHGICPDCTEKFYSNLNLYPENKEEESSK